jgi:superfamily II DNA/RNA helicase
MIVTDVAARGLDVPDLDCVINYDCPAKAKLFVHRVGRAARAGRSGFAYSLIGSDEVAFLPDLQLFLGRQDVSAPALLVTRRLYCATHMRGIAHVQLCLRMQLFVCTSV